MKRIMFLVLLVGLLGIQSPASSPAQGAQAIASTTDHEVSVAYNVPSAPVTGAILPLPRPVISASSDYSLACNRFGVGVSLDYGNVDDYDVGRLQVRWYVDWSTQLSPPRPGGMDYMQMVQTSGDTFSPNETALAAIVAANPGATWLIGNEPDSIWQGNSTPDQYAQVYHQLYTFLKAHDPTCRVTVGGIVQATDLRLQWLDAVLEAYQTRYGEALPVDLWNIHTFILREERGSWGAEIPPGISASHGELWDSNDHDDMDLLAGQIVRFRQWMQDRGDRDKELVVSEYGILLPDWLGFDESRVQAFMRNTFEYFMTAADLELGYPADGNRLVQRWAWYSLNDKRFEGETSHSHLFDPDTKEITPLGIDFENYVTPLCTPYPDLVPESITFSPSQPLALDGQPITVTVTATVRNAGNDTEPATNVPLRFWVGDPGHPIGEEQTIAALAARSLDSVSVEWQGVSSGLYTVGVTVDAGAVIAESDESNNQLSRSLLVTGHAVFLPLVIKQR